MDNNSVAGIAVIAALAAGGAYLGTTLEARQHKEVCAVTATAGKLCGSDLASWCHITQGLRDDPGSGMDAATVSETNRVCARAQ